MGTTRGHRSYTGCTAKAGDAALASWSYRFEFKARHTVGVLVQANHGVRDRFSVNGVRRR